MPKLSRLTPSGPSSLLLLLGILLLLRLPDALSFLRLNLRGSKLMHQQVKGWLAASPFSRDQGLASRLPGCDLIEDPGSDGKLNDKVGVRFHRFSFLAQFLCAPSYESLKHDAWALQAENPKDGTADWLLAKSAFAGGHFDEARRILRSASLDESILAYTFAEEAYAGHDPGRAADILDIFGSWKDEPVVTERARFYDLACAAYRDAHRNRDAVPSCLKLAAAAPKSAASWAQLASGYLGAGQINEAIAAAQKAVSLDPQNADFHVSLGACYQSAQMMSEADASYETALRLHPDYALARLMLAASLLEQDRCQEAKTTLSKIAVPTADMLGQITALQAAITTHCDVPLLQPSSN